jgi:CSLREA domain-containing protein
MRYLQYAVLGLLAPVALLVALSPARADQLVANEFQATSSGDIETTPTLGSDNGASVLVYTSIDLATFTSRVRYQRLTDTGTLGPAVDVGSGNTNDNLNDVSGDWIVYTATQPTNPGIRQIRKYRISDGFDTGVSGFGAMGEARIHGGNIAWVEGNTIYLSVAGAAATPIAGPVPAASQLEIGDSFVVFQQDGDIWAYDLRNPGSSKAANGGSNPTTSGSWVVWESAGIIQGANLDTGATVALGSALDINANPSIDGNNIAWESNAAGNFDIYLHRLAEGDSFQVTTNPADQQLDSLHGNQVAYLDNRSGLDIYVSTFSFVPPPTPTAITVTTIDDELNSDGDCSLREAIQAANTDAVVDACPAGSGADTIDLPAGTYTLSIAGAGEDANLTGDLDVTADLTINGAGAATTIIQACAIVPPSTSCTGLDRVFHIDPSAAGVTAEISGLTIQNGSASFGGGISNGGTLTIDSSTVSGNSAGAFGPGGGIFNGGTMTVNNSTVSGNGAGDGGGILNFGTATLTSSTVSGNTAPSTGGGISNFTGASATLKNTIVANSPSGGDCSGIITSDGHNLDSDGTCGLTGTGDLSNTNPLLGPLADNGGPTQTHALLGGSPAIDAGSPDCPPPATDQRGVARPQGAACDMGAYEHEPTPTPTPTPCPDSDGDGWCDATDNCPLIFNPGQQNNVHPLTPTGDHCEDPEPDGVFDIDDNCPDWPNPGQGLPPWAVPANDPDCDGFDTTTENWVGTLPLQQCGDTTPNNESPQPWPTDNNDDAWSKLDDVLRYIPVFNTLGPLSPAEKRYDLNADDKITLADVLKYIPFFNRQCT